MTPTANRLLTRGIALAQRQQLGEAANCFEQAIRADPALSAAYGNLGLARELMGDLAGAISCYERAIELDPTSFELLRMLGEIQFKVGNYARAAACFQNASALAPGDAALHCDLGTSLWKLHHYDEAAAAARRAIALAPHGPAAYSVLGVTLTSTQNYDEAESCLRQAIELDPLNATTHTNLGVLYKQWGRLDDASRCYQRSIEIRPNNPEARKARAMCQLLQGNFEAGWPDFEWRIELGDVRVIHAAPRWTGDPLSGRSLLIEAEQGMGDTIQFIRYAAEIKRHHHGQVIVACESSLVTLLRNVAGIDILLGQNERRPPFEVWTPMLSLPGIFRHGLGTLPAPIPYLTAEPDRVERWKQFLTKCSGFKIGIAWQGNKDWPQDHKRSFPLAAFAPLAELTGVTLISLQKGYGGEQLQACGFAVASLDDDFDSSGGAFLDTAAVMKNLDLVISSDTSVAHLAGALGIPVWLALPYVPDWRWTMHGDRTPWYPTMRLFRQTKPGDWPGVFDRIAAAVRVEHPGL